MKKICTVLGTVVMIVGVLSSISVAITIAKAGFPLSSAFIVFLSIILSSLALSVLFFAMSKVLHMLNIIALNTYDTNEVLTKIIHSEVDSNVKDNE